MMSDSTNTRMPSSLYWRIIGILFAAVVLLNLIGFVPGLADWFAVNAYPTLTDPLSRLLDLTRIPIGEVLMFGGIALVVGAVMFACALVFLRNRNRAAYVCRTYLKATLAIVLCTALLFTLNWAIPFRSTPLIQTLANDEKTYTLDELEKLRNELVENLNKSADEVPRTASGSIAYAANTDEQVANALSSLGEEFPRLSGFYPTPKPALCSDVLEWMGIGGYTYPYTMEVTFNRYVSKLYYPVLSAHESVHHKGYYLESDAEFLSFLACTRSPNTLLRYSAYENIYYYVESAYTQALLAKLDSKDAKKRYLKQVQVSSQVLEDRERVAEERRLAYESGVDKAAEGALSGLAGDVSKYGWETQGQILQENSYAGVVDLLLAYTYR